MRSPAEAGKIATHARPPRRAPRGSRAGVRRQRRRSPAERTFVAEADERQQQCDGRVEPYARRRACASCTGPSVFHARNSAPCATSATQREHADAHRVPVEDPHGITRGEVREERQREPSRLVERQPAQQVPEGGAEQDRERDARCGEDEVPRRAPRAGIEMAAELNRDPAQDERPQHEEDGEVEARQPRGEHRGNATNRTPPSASSQTSLPSQNGPMAASTCRRSASVFATNRCRAPAPKSKPSMTT